MEAIHVSYSTRHFVTLMLFMGMAMAYIMRTNMSVAIVAMVNHSAINKEEEKLVEECPGQSVRVEKPQDGEFPWDTKTQGYILSSFFYGYVIMQIPVGILAKKYGAKGFLGWGMFLDATFALLVPFGAHYGGAFGVCFVRFVQGVGESPIVPCTHTLLSKWIPPNERSRAVAITYAGAQFGTILSMPVSGLLCEYGYYGGWPSIYYLFGTLGICWATSFILFVKEDPSSDPNIDPQERDYINDSLGRKEGEESPPIPYWSILTCLPFYAVLLAHMGHNYGYETLMTELPTYMKQVLGFSLKSNGFYSALPYLSMWLFSMVISIAADSMIASERFSRNFTRKLANSLGQYGPGIALIVASYTGCNPTLTLAILTLGMGLNGGIYSGFKANHLDMSTRFAGFTMSITNCLANIAGLSAPIIAGHLISGQPSMSNWQKVFFIAGGIYIFCGTFYNIFGSCRHHPWEKEVVEEVEDVNKKK